MSFSQHVDDCKVHPDCEVISYYDGDWQVWQSHAHRDTHVACRLGDAAPECHDVRTGETHINQTMCGDCTDHFAAN
jgi:hypothetical protein